MPPHKFLFKILGGQLRYQLYIWLEHEVEALRQLCNYSANVSAQDQIDNAIPDDSTLNEDVFTTNDQKLTLHEILMQEKLDFEAKVQRAARRKRWLKGKLI